MQNLWQEFLDDLMAAGDDFGNVIITVRFNGDTLTRVDDKISDYEIGSDYVDIYYSSSEFMIRKDGYNIEVDREFLPNEKEYKFISDRLTIYISFP